MNPDQAVRDQLLYLLNGGNAHMTFDEVVERFPLDKINAFPPDVFYTPWHIVEHMRLCQWDIVDYIHNPNYVEPKFPDDLWPAREAQADQAQWEMSLAGFRADLETLKRVAADPQTDLYAGLPHAPQHNILREILVIADHNAYHIGELAVLRQVMGAWHAGRVSV